MTSPVRLIFLGTPQLATIPLRALHAIPDVQIVAVITQPDRPSGRGRQLTPPPVKVVAQELGIATILQPETLKDDAIVAQITALAPDIGVVAAYGEILRKNVLAIPPHGYLNIHPSLLPRHRGPAPVTSAILAGDNEVGVSVMQLGSKMDAGPILLQHRQPLSTNDRAGTLTEALFHVGARLLCDALRPYIDGTLIPTPQDDAHATYIGLLSRDDGRIDWSQSASQIARMNRAYDPWPGTFTILNDQPLRIITASALAQPNNLPTGSVVETPQGPAVACGSGLLLLHTVQPAGKSIMAAQDWYRGLRQPNEIILA
ncbi:MAG: methionyl-tRNA formyltransferase [Roseiflexaceae bacterium]